MSGSGAIASGLIYMHITVNMHACKLFVVQATALACLLLHLVLMAKLPRVQSLKDEETCKALVKAHLHDPSNFLGNTLFRNLMGIR